MKFVEARIILIAVLLLQGCASHPWNSPASLLDTTQVAYNVAGTPPKAKRSDDVFVVLAFSGGGMRSAAFSYGLLSALRDTTIELNGHSQRLLDEVDVITSVSGGSYTAAYYGLFGERIFRDYERDVLGRDVQGELTSLLVNPLVLASLIAPGNNRSDVAAAWLDEQIFERRTLEDMRRPDGPMVIINASDINTGTTFSFIQQQFDFLCSNVNDFPIGRAVMASSAVPGYFAPIAIKNFKGDCPGRRSLWVSEALQTRDVYSRNFHVARALERYADAEAMPIVRLLDGGLTDNLGVRGSMISPIMHNGNVEEMSGVFNQMDLDRVSKVLVVVANAQIYENYAWSRAGRDPGLIGSLSASFDSAIGILNSETIGLARKGFEDWAKRTSRRPKRVGKPPVDVSFVALTFDDIDDADERRYFNSIPMALSVSDRHRHDLQALAGRLLQQSPEFEHFLSIVK